MPNPSLRLYPLLRFTTMTTKFVLCVKLIGAVLLQRCYISKNVIFWTYFACRAQDVAIGTFWTTKVARFALEFEAARFASGWVFGRFWLYSEILFLMSRTGKCWWRQLFHRTLVFFLLLRLFFLFLGLKLFFGLHLLWVHLHNLKFTARKQL